MRGHIKWQRFGIWNLLEISPKIPKAANLETPTSGCWLCWLLVVGWRWQVHHTANDASHQLDTFKCSHSHTTGQDKSLQQQCIQASMELPSRRTHRAQSAANFICCTQCGIVPQRIAFRYCLELQKQQWSLEMFFSAGGWWLAHPYW
ncbi:unnamed protein product [Ceratitis capitata]|uniref:(Mediterranean fruit fly) hypothetical protein n=1 Tax=Ceratitis capitata TaxID=7213 RepID=A0A811UV16_CERCA|nr:unnamed protein product [Ceratitis capitata]